MLMADSSFTTHYENIAESHLVIRTEFQSGRSVRLARSSLLVRAGFEHAPCDKHHFPTSVLSRDNHHFATNIT